MLHFFQDVLNEVESLKSKVQGATSAAATSVKNGTAWTEDEIKTASSGAFTKIEAASMTLSQAFTEGAKWAAARVQSATAEPTVATVVTPEAAPVSAPVAVEVAPAVVAAPVEAVVAPAVAPVVEAAPVAVPAADATATAQPAA